MGEGNHCACDHCSGSKEEGRCAFCEVVAESARLREEVERKDLALSAAAEALRLFLRQGDERPLLTWKQALVTGSAALSVIRAARGEKVDG